jgi:hypothetical protein
MTKVSVVLYYWILVVAVLLFARLAGLADNNEAIIKILIVVTIIYVGVAMISRTQGKALEEKRRGNGNAGDVAASGMKRKKKKR